MKIKIILFIVISMFIFVPSFAGARFAPYFDINIVKNTVGGDGVFDFHWYHSQYDHGSFQIETANGSGIGYAMAFAGPGDTIIISEDQQAGWQYTGAYCFSNNQQVTYQITSNGVSITAYPFSSITCTLTNVKVNEKTPVLIVPGLMGTEMKSGNDLLWADLGRMATDAEDSFMDPLSFDKNLTPSDLNIYISDVIGSKTVGPFKFDYTEGLVNELKNQGYVENETLFTFPYDWRYGVSGKYADGKTNSDFLAQKIQDIMAQTGSDKVDIVAHSLGGLIVKKYVVDNQADNHIGKAVFVGVPNTGSPKAVKVLLQGDNFSVPWLADSEIKKIAENLPASYDLLPDEQYYNIKGSFVSLLDVGYGIGEPTEKDLNYQEFKSYLNDKGLNLSATANSESLHNQTFDDFDLRTAGVDLYNIVGCKTATMTNLLEVKYKDVFGNYKTDYDKVELKIGDGTVPLESSTNLPIDQANKYYALISDHGKMPSQNGIRQQIVNLISGSNLNIGNNLITQNINECQLNGKAISAFSPVDIFVTDQNGKKLGLAEDQSIINEIPNADFEIFGEHKFIYLPTDNGQTYNINMNGTGSGTYTIKSQDITNSQTTKTEVFSNLPVTADLTGQIIINPADNTTSLIVRQSSANEPVIILPSSVIDAAQSDDVLPPASTAILAGVVYKPGFYRNNVAIDINATDRIVLGKESETSGVLDIEYNLDNAGYQKVQGDTAVINASDEGEHTITFFSTDKAGNNEQGQTIAFAIINLPTSKEQCKKDGWKNFGNKFKNQGGCVSFVENGKIIE